MHRVPRPLGPAPAAAAPRKARTAERQWRRDVAYLLPGGKQSIGIVDYPQGKPDRPTLFIEAICKTRADRDWFDHMTVEIIEALNERARRRLGAKEEQAG